MQDIATAIAAWKSSLEHEVEAGRVIARSKIAHKWKATWRGLLLRESVSWRAQDLLEQSHSLFMSSYLLGARILMRSALETIAVLIHLNQATRKVIAGTTDFHGYSKQTTQLLLGSRDKSTPYDSINILTILGHASKRYPGLQEMYAALSECAHPNYEGMLHGYSEADTRNFTTTFQNRWGTLYGDNHLEAIRICMEICITEYNDEWTDAFEALERWIEQNDAMLEATKPAES